MTGVPVGVLINIMDALMQASGGESIIDRADEKVYRYIRDSPGRNGSGSFRFNPYGSKGYRSRGGGGPSRRTNPRRPSSGYRSKPRTSQYRPRYGKSRKSTKRCKPGYYYNHKARRCMKSKFR